MNRRGNNKNYTKGHDRRGRPNILVILVDQLRFPQGSFDQATLDQAAPNLAKLRSESVSFDAHYAAATACSPSRSTLLTGLYTHQNAMFLTNVEGLAGVPPTPDLIRIFLLGGPFCKVISVTAPSGGENGICRLIVPWIDTASKGMPCRVHPLPEAQERG